MRRQVLALVCGAVLLAPAVSEGQSGRGNAGGPPNGPLTVDRWWMPDGFDPASVTIHINPIDTSKQTDGPGPPSLLNPPPVQGLLEFGGETSTIPQQSFVCVADCDEPRSVPEPGVVLLLGGGLVALAVRRRRQRDARVDGRS